LPKSIKRRPRSTLQTRRVAVSSRLPAKAAREPKKPMALHRDIYWVGKQWAVTGFGVQACDQKQKGKFDIEGSRLWEDGVLESLRAEKWLNAEDFDKAIAVARKHYPEPPRKDLETIGKVASPRKRVAPSNDAAPTEPQRSPLPNFNMRIERAPARFLRQWRVRIRR
jgi:hypothetical protein